jgi:hypothetical protein
MMKELSKPAPLWRLLSEVRSFPDEILKELRVATSRVYRIPAGILGDVAGYLPWREDLGLGDAALNGLRIVSKDYKAAVEEYLQEPRDVTVSIFAPAKREGHHSLFIHSTGDGYGLKIELLGVSGRGLEIKASVDSCRSPFDTPFSRQLDSRVLLRTLDEAAAGFGVYNVLANSCQQFVERVALGLGAPTRDRYIADRISEIGWPIVLVLVLVLCVEPKPPAQLQKANIRTPPNKAKKGSDDTTPQHPAHQLPEANRRVRTIVEPLQ